MLKYKNCFHFYFDIMLPARSARPRSECWKQRMEALPKGAETYAASGALTPRCLGSSSGRLTLSNNCTSLAGSFATPLCVDRIRVSNEFRGLPYFSLFSEAFYVGAMGERSHGITMPKSLQRALHLGQSAHGGIG